MSYCSRDGLAFLPAIFLDQPFKSTQIPLAALCDDAAVTEPCSFKESKIQTHYRTGQYLDWHARCSTCTHSTPHRHIARRPHRPYRRCVRSLRRSQSHCCCCCRIAPPLRTPIPSPRHPVRTLCQRQPLQTAGLAVRVGGDPSVARLNLRRSSPHPLRASCPSGPATASTSGPVLRCAYRRRTGALPLQPGRASVQRRDAKLVGVLVRPVGTDPVLVPSAQHDAHVAAARVQHLRRDV